MTRPKPSTRLADDRDVDDLFVRDAGKAVSAAHDALKAARERTDDLNRPRNPRGIGAQR